MNPNGRPLTNEELLSRVAELEDQLGANIGEFERMREGRSADALTIEDLRLADDLAEKFLQELENSWTVDTRNIVYADESDPLDLYRTILRLDDLRKPVFAGAGGSLLVLSPLGSKVMALGALMAALERDLPVAHLEPIGYDLAMSVPEGVAQASLVHVWLEGSVYPSPRPSLQAEGGEG